MAQYDELLDDTPDSQAFDADLDPVGYDPDTIEESNVVVEEPKILNIGRKLHKDEVRKLRDQPESPSRSH